MDPCAPVYGMGKYDVLSVGNSWECLGEKARGVNITIATEKNTSIFQPFQDAFYQLYLYTNNTI